MDQIALKGMAFFGYHGDEPEETRLGQRFYIDVLLGVDLSTVAETDQLEDSVNYVEVYTMVKRIAEGDPCRLLERIAGKINDEVLASFPQVQTVETVVHKPGAPIPGVLNDVSVRIAKHRNE
ncbi:MAG: dihydroneopterin aldolase [Dialister sp.]|nr:dihydroneopterin aldolase [Dialister sp.]